MTLSWTTEHVTTLAPDGSSLKNGRALAAAAKWQNLGQAEGVLWGEIKGSGATPYQTCIEQATPSFKCSCPSRKFPCKHGLGLALIFTTQPEALKQGEYPAWVAEWLEKREQRAQKQAKKADAEAVPVDDATLQKRAQAQEKRRAAHQDKVSAGVEELQAWLYDQVRHGLAHSVADHRPWEKMAARMIDAQAPGLAMRLQRCSEARFAGDGWQEKLLHETARLHLLLAAYRRRDALPSEVQADLAAQLGETVNQGELAAQSGVADSWLVMGQALEERDALRSQRTWLYGLQQRRFALLLDFAAANQALALRPPLGSAFGAELVFYPGSWPLRALLKDERGSADARSAHSAFVSIAAALQGYQQRLAQSPWLERYPCALSQVVPVLQAGCWAVVGESQAMLPLQIGDAQGWHLLALSGGLPVDLFGEWDGERLLPLAVFGDTAERL